MTAQVQSGWLKSLYIVADMTHGDIDIVPLICFRFNITSTFGRIIVIIVTVFYFERKILAIAAIDMVFKENLLGGQPQFANKQTFFELNLPTNRFFLEFCQQYSVDENYRYSGNVPTSYILGCGASATLMVTPFVTCMLEDLLKYL